MEEIVPNNINGVLVSIKDGMHQLDIPSEMTGEQFAGWKKGRGGVFSKDVYLWNMNKLCGKYILMEGDGKKFILRLIEEDEVKKFKSCKLIEGKVKDKPYMKLVDLSKNAKSKRKFKYIEEID